MRPGDGKALTLGGDVVATMRDRRAGGTRDAAPARPGPFAGDRRLPCGSRRLARAAATARVAGARQVPHGIGRRMRQLPFPARTKGEPLFDKGLSGGMVFDVPPFRAVRR